MVRNPFTRSDSIDPGEAVRRLHAGDLILVDVREQAELRQGRVADALHIPLVTVPGQIDALTRRATSVAFICRSGHRSAAACALARSRGLMAINVRGGMQAWQRAGLPITSD